MTFVKVTINQLLNFLFETPGSGPVYITGVVKNSHADKVGICPGDMLLNVNGHRVKRATKEVVENLISIKCKTNLRLILIAGAASMEQAGTFSKNELKQRIQVSEFYKKVSVQTCILFSDIVINT